MSRDGLVTGALAPVLSNDLDGDDTSFDVISARERAAVYEVLVVTLCEQALMAMTHSRWSQAEALAGEARTVFRRAGIQKSYAIPLVCAVQARAALHRGDVVAARQELIGAQRLRHLLTYAMPSIAIQTRIELARVYLALGDLAGAETVIQEIDELLRRRPDLSSLADEAEVLQARVLQALLPEERGPSPDLGHILTLGELAKL
jgi:LuxR family transcriptional regulator, maltose regulon positive regulatory protein